MTLGPKLAIMVLYAHYGHAVAPLWRVAIAERIEWPGWASGGPIAIGVGEQLEEPVTSLADLLKAWRRANFMAQKDLAKKLGVTCGTVQRWEAGLGLPFPAKQRKLVEVLAIPPDELRAALDASALALKRRPPAHHDEQT